MNCPFLFVLFTTAWKGFLPSLILAFLSHKYLFPADWSRPDKCLYSSLIIAAITLTVLVLEIKKLSTENID